MRKLIAGTMIAAGAVLAGGQLASADYPPDDQISPQPPVDAPESPTPGTTLPSTGGESRMLLQLGLITVAAGGTLVGAAAVRRRRTSDA